MQVTQEGTDCRRGGPTCREVVLFAPADQLLTHARLISRTRLRAGARRRERQDGQLSLAGGGRHMRGMTAAFRYSWT